MKMRSVMKALVVLTVFVAFSGGFVFAADAPEDTMQLVREKIKADKKLLVAMNMNLTEAEAEKFWPLYEEYQKARETVLSRFGGLVDSYAADYQNMTDDKAAALMDNLLAVEGDFLALQKAYLPKFMKVLPAVKAARYFQMENKIMAILRYDAAANIPLM